VGGYDDDVALDDDGQWRFARRTTYRQLGVSPTFLDLRQDAPDRLRPRR
jgi:hypothetical protein